MLKRLYKRAEAVLSLRPPLDAENEWRTLAKRTVARFARGNIAAQHGRILMPEDQEREHKRAQRVVRKWRLKRA